MHTTVPVILYEHQRLDTRIKTLATNGGKPKFSAYHLGREGRRAPYELVLWGGETEKDAKAKGRAESPSGSNIRSSRSMSRSSSTGSHSSPVRSQVLPAKKTIPAWRSTVQLPTLEESFILPKPVVVAQAGSPIKDANDGVERSHFWM